MVQSEPGGQGPKAVTGWCRFAAYVGSAAMPPRATVVFCSVPEPDAEIRISSVEPSELTWWIWMLYASVPPVVSNVAPVPTNTPTYRFSPARTCGPDPRLA